MKKLANHPRQRDAAELSMPAQGASRSELDWEPTFGRDRGYVCGWPEGNVRFSLRVLGYYRNDREEYELQCWGLGGCVAGYRERWVFDALQDAKDFALIIAAERRDVWQKHLAQIEREKAQAEHEKELARRLHIQMAPIRTVYRVAYWFARPAWRVARFLRHVWEPLPPLRPGIAVPPCTEHELRAARTYLWATFLPRYALEKLCSRTD